MSLSHLSSGTLALHRGAYELALTTPDIPANPYADGQMDVGDPVPESERNTTIKRETTEIRNIQGKVSDEWYGSAAIQVGVDYRFNRFISVGVGVKAERWFNVGQLSEVMAITDPIAHRAPSGDIGFEGWFLGIKLTPR